MAHFLSKESVLNLNPNVPNVYIRKSKHIICPIPPVLLIHYFMI